MTRKISILIMFLGVVLMFSASGVAKTQLESSEQQCLAVAIYNEANGEPLRGQLAVGAVIMNRVHAGIAPSVCGVVHQRVGHHWQFGYNVKKKKIPAEKRQYFYEIANNVLSGRLESVNFPKKVLYFNNHSFDRRKYCLYCVIGHQKFYFRNKS